MSKLYKLSTTEEIDACVAEHGGSYRDALNVCLAKLKTNQEGWARAIEERNKLEIECDDLHKQLIALEQSETI